MEQFSISVFLLLFQNCLAPHFGCPKDRPFLSDTNKCGSFSDICINYRSEECEFGIKACEQCPLSNFSSAILDRVLRAIYGGENKNCSQSRNEIRSIQEFSRAQLIILIIVVFLLIFTVLIFLVTIGICIRIRKRKTFYQGSRNLMEMSMEEISRNRILMQMEEISNELSNFRNKMILTGKTNDICISWQNAEQGFIPPGAINVGKSCYVARAKHDGDYIPGKLIKDDKFVYIGYAGQAIQKHSYQVLVDTSILNKPILEWNDVYDREIPLGAIIGGTDNGKALYIARYVIEDEYVVGKYQPEHDCVYFTVGDKEIKKNIPISVLCYSKVTDQC